MREPIFITLLVLASIVPLAVFAIVVARPRGANRAVDVIAGLLGAILWGVVGLGASGIETFNPATGETTVYSEPALVWISVALAGMSLLLMVFGSAQLVSLEAVTSMPLNESDEKL